MKSRTCGVLNVGSFKEIVKMKILSEGLIHCLFLSDHLLLEGFGHFVSLQLSGHLKKTHSVCFAAVSLEECGWEQGFAHLSGWHALIPGGESWLPTWYRASRPDCRGSEDYCWCYPKPSHQLRWWPGPSSAALMAGVIEPRGSKQAGHKYFLL